MSTLHALSRRAIVDIVATSIKFVGIILKDKVDNW